MQIKIQEICNSRVKLVDCDNNVYDGFLTIDYHHFKVAIINLNNGVVYSFNKTNIKKIIWPSGVSFTTKQLDLALLENLKNWFAHINKEMEKHEN
ncbi:hypothetical protein [Mycoplasma miroungigenitalium]|nr:hypothetical protein [Mycoplasma miroungigenitalium]